MLSENLQSRPDLYALIFFLMFCLYLMGSVEYCKVRVFNLTLELGLVTLWYLMVISPGSQPTEKELPVCSYTIQTSVGILLYR